ncbi:MAG TPA: hypothetical protein VFQ99_01140 [Gallionella sp.]|nr:hypothetical protein [Gallionella sp.]
MMSNSHPEYRLVLPVAAGMDGVAPHVRAAIEQLGEWEERSQDDLDGSRSEHRAAMEDITAYGAHLWMVSADYTGRIEVMQPGPVCC